MYEEKSPWLARNHHRPDLSKGVLLRITTPHGVFATRETRRPVIAMSLYKARKDYLAQCKLVGIPCSTSVYDTKLATFIRCSIT